MQGVREAVQGVDRNLHARRRKQQQQQQEQPQKQQQKPQQEQQQHEQQRDSGACDGGVSLSRASFHTPDEYAQMVYSKHAEVVPSKFRVAIDCSIQEKPKQILSSVVVVLILLILTNGSGWLGRPEAEYRLFDKEMMVEVSEERERVLRFWILQVIACLSVAIIGYCFLESRDGLLVRPHPGFWRIIHGLCLTYFLFFVFLLAIHREDGRRLIHILLPGSRTQGNVFKGTLVLDCSLNVNTIYRQLTSVWFISHAVGWCLKMCIFRSWMFNLTFSILFEFCEISLQWLIPEFQECWWDSIFLDAIISNLLGMIVGCAVMRWFGERHFDWLGAYPTYQKIMLKFTPFSSCDYGRSFFRTPRHLLMTSLILCLSLLTEINAFLLMTVLDIPVTQWINPARLIFLAILALPAVAEFHAQVHFPYDRLGANVLLFPMLLVVELLVSVKYGADRFNNTTPTADIVLPWLLALSLFVMWCYCYFTYNSKHHSHVKQTHPNNKLDYTLKCFWFDAHTVLLKVPPQACFLPLILLFKHYYYGGPSE